jgi:hypothetical protein
LIHAASDAPTPVQNQSRSRLPLAITAITITMLTAFGVFILPFFFPPSHSSRSAAYTAGFNNRVADAATALISLLAFATAWRFRIYPRAPQLNDRRRTPLWLLAASVTVCVAFTTWLSWILTKAQISLLDTHYFLEPLDDVIRYHQLIYTDFTFPYGPLLLYFPLWMHTLLKPFHIELQGSYYVALTIAESLGLVLLYYTLEALPLSRRAKSVTFALFTLAALCPLMGLNYSLVRSLLPFSTLLFMARAKKPLLLASLFLLGEILQLAVSPELGFAFAAGACFYALCLTLQKGPAWIPAIAAPPLAVALFLAVVGKAYLDSMAAFSRGALNLIVEPLGYILLFLLATVWLVPIMLARLFRERRPDAVLMASLFVTCLALVPVALGFCDTLHVFYNAVGIYLLGTVAISSYPKSARELWFFFLACILLWMQFINYVMRPDLRQAARIVYRHAPRHDFIDIARLQAIVGSAQVSTPFAIPLKLEEELKSSGHYLPDREFTDFGVADAPSETARAARMDACQWALIPALDPTLTETPYTTTVLVGIGYNFYPDRQKPYVVGAIILDDLKEHWKPIARVGDWILYRNNQIVTQPLTNRAKS